MIIDYDKAHKDGQMKDEDQRTEKHNVTKIFLNKSLFPFFSVFQELK